MVIKRFNVELDIKRSSSNREFEVVEGDNGNELVVTLTDDGEPVDLSGCIVIAVFSKCDGRTAQQDNQGHGITVGGEHNNELTIELYTSSFAPGLVECEIQVISVSIRLLRPPNSISPVARPYSTRKRCCQRMNTRCCWSLSAP